MPRKITWTEAQDTTLKRMRAEGRSWDEIGAAETDAEKERITAKQGELQEKIEALGAWDVAPQVEMAMDALRCPPGDTLVDTLSGGERRRVALARLLLQNPAIKRHSKSLLRLQRSYPT